MDVVRLGRTESQDLDAEVSCLWYEGMAIDEIGRRLRIGNGRLYKVLNRLELRRSHPLRRFWTPEREAELRRMWGDGVKVIAIAAHFGTGVGKITGKARRLGLDQRKPSPRRDEPRQEQPAQPRIKVKRETRKQESAPPRMARYKKRLPGRLCLLMGFVSD